MSNADYQRVDFFSLMLPAVAPLQLRASPLLLRRSRSFSTTETMLVAFCFASLIVFQWYFRLTLLTAPLYRVPRVAEPMVFMEL